MAEKLFHRIFRNPGAEPPDRPDRGIGPTRTADHQSELLADMKGSEHMLYRRAGLGSPPVDDRTPLRDALLAGKSSGTLRVPLRNTLTQTFGGQLGIFARVPGEEAPTTYLTIVPLEAPCLAVRVAYGNCFDTPVTIQSVSVYPSDTYNLALETIHNGGLSVPVIPTDNGSLNNAGCKLYFDGHGLDASGRDSVGSIRTKALDGNPENTVNRFLPHAYEWTDWAPCRSRARADGGIHPLLFIYTTLSSPAGTFVRSNLQSLNSGSRCEQRYHFGFKATTRRADFADNPAGTEFHATDGGGTSWNPVVAVQYLTEEPGIQVISVGDGLAVGPTDDPFAGPIWRACTHLSSAALPIAYASFACAGEGPSVYNPLTLLNTKAIQPSISALQVITRNGYAGHRHMCHLLDEMLHLAGELEARYGSRFIFNIPGGEPAWEENPPWADAFVEVRNTLLGASEPLGVAVIDAPAVTAPRNAPWRYDDGLSTDGVHLNTLGAERVVPLALRAIHHSLQTDPPRFDRVLAHFEPMTRQAAQPESRPEQFRRLEAEAQRLWKDQKWSEALGKYDELRSRFPERPAGYVGAIQALRHLDKADAADALVLDARERFPKDGWLTIQRAELAMRQQDWATAEGLWRAVLLGKNDFWWVHQHLSRALREQGRVDEAEAALVEGQLLFPAEQGLFAEHARQAMQRRDWLEAVRCWEAVRTRFPDQTSSYLEGAAALRELGRLDEAEALLESGTERFVNEARPAIEFAIIAHHRREWDKAVDRWQRFRARFPDKTEGYLFAAIALRQLGRQKEAEEVIVEGARRLPDSVELAGQFAWAAAHQLRWAEAEARFAELIERFPDAPVGYMGGAVAQRAQGRFAEGDAILEAAMARLPPNPEIALEYARLRLTPEHYQRNDLDEAFRRLEVLRSSFPGYEQGWRDSIRHARQAERFEMAEELAAAARENFPDSAEIAALWATAAADRGNHEEAVIRFQNLLDRFPNHEPGYTGIANALARADRYDEADDILCGAQVRFPHSPEVACA